MGDIYPNIDTTKGPPPGMHVDRLSWKTRCSRSPEDTTFVVVRDEKIPRFTMAGVFPVVIRSSNYGRAPFGEGWADRAVSEVQERLGSNEGQIKGRVLYAIGQGWSLEEGFRHEIVLGALAYHLPKLGEVQVVTLEATREITTHRSTVLQALLLCGERVASESSGGDRCRLLWEVGRGVARTITSQYDMHTLKRVRGNRVVLYRDGKRRA